MTLATQIAADVADVFLNSDDFGETVSYTPVGGSARSIVAVVVTMPSDLTQESSHEVAHNFVSVLAAKSASTGIEAPAKGDTIVWSGRIYSWVGIIHQDAGAWQLKFSCPQIVSSGPRQSFGF